MRIFSIPLLLLFAPVCSFAQAQDKTKQTPDTTNTQQLKEVLVEGDLQQTNAQVTTYIPTAREKRASQTGVDLIEQMGIPQLMVVDNTIQSNSGKPVAVFIDYIPATPSDLEAMRMADVKRVEYYESPSDPRLQGNQFVVNYIMAKYEYGGYIKGLGYLFAPFYTERLQTNARVQYKKMTYDILGFAKFNNDRHTGETLTETFRIPQPDGELKEFKRYSNTLSGHQKRTIFQGSFKASYNSEKVQAVSLISGNLNNMPIYEYTGNVTYTPADYPSSNYTTSYDSYSKSIHYYGYYFFILPKNNSLKLNPRYSFSHTETGSTYTEGGFSPILNGATDNTNSLSAQLRYGHNFGKYGDFGISLDGQYDYSRTAYTGSAVSFDRSRIYVLSAGANYDVTVGKFYGYTSVGWQWYKSVFSGIKDINRTIWADLSLQYAFSKKHSLSAEFHYSSWPPSASFKSENIIHSTPLMYYTGNPSLVANKVFDYSLRYTWFPDRNYTFSVYANGWNVKDRYVYCYEPYGNALIRTIRQPLGTYVQGCYGLTTTLRFLKRSLVFTGRISNILNHNGRPYNVNHSSVGWYGRLRYYFKNWNFSAYYASASGAPDGFMVGDWVRNRSTWSVSAGWSDDHWNIRCTLHDLTRWHYMGMKTTMESEYYDKSSTILGISDHAMVQLSFTYTFGFGKKVKQNNELSVSDQTSSGILKN